MNAKEFVHTRQRKAPLEGALTHTPTCTARGTVGTVKAMTASAKIRMFKANYRADRRVKKVLSHT